MTREEVLKLVNAGFSKEEIVAFQSAEEFTETPAQEEPTTEEVIVEPTEPTINSELKGTLEEIGRTLKDIQKLNLRFTSYPEESGRTPEDIIGEIIAPQNFKKGD